MLELVLQHGLLDRRLLRRPHGLAHLTAVGRPGRVSRQSQTHAHRRFVRVDQRIVVDLAVVGQPDGGVGRGLVERLERVDGL